MRTEGLASKLVLTLVAAAALCACGPTCGGTTSTSSGGSGHSPSAARNGTYQQDITITGPFHGHVSSGYGFCSKTAEAFQGSVQDATPGSPLAFDFNIRASAYHGAGTYGPADGSIATLGSVYMPGQETWVAKSGTFTVNAGEKSGSIHMHLESGPGTQPEDISGTWRCG